VNLVRWDIVDKSVNLDLQNVKKILGNASVEEGYLLCEIVTRHFFGISIGCVSKSLVLSGVMGDRPATQVITLLKTEKAV